MSAPPYSFNVSTPSVHVYISKATSILCRRNLKTQLVLLSTLIRQVNKTFRKRYSNPRNLKTPGFGFCLDGKHFENRGFRKRWRNDNHVISLTEFCSNTNLKRPELLRSPVQCGGKFSSSTGVEWTGLKSWVISWEKRHLVLKRWFYTQTIKPPRMLLTTQKLKCYGFHPLPFPFDSNLSRLNCEKKRETGSAGLDGWWKTLHTHWTPTRERSVETSLVFDQIFHAICQTWTCLQTPSKLY